MCSRISKADIPENILRRALGHTRIQLNKVSEWSQTTRAGCSGLLKALNRIFKSTSSTSSYRSFESKKKRGGCTSRFCSSEGCLEVPWTWIHKLCFRGIWKHYRLSDLQPLPKGGTGNRKKSMIMKFFYYSFLYNLINAISDIIKTWTLGWTCFKFHLNSVRWLYFQWKAILPLVLTVLCIYIQVYCTKLLDFFICNVWYKLSNLYRLYREECLCAIPFSFILTYCLLIFFFLFW